MSGIKTTYGPSWLSRLWSAFSRPNNWSNRGAIFGGIILFALVAFEIFNFSTTQYSLSDMLGDLKFAGMRWASILAFAFCSIDLAGIARIFTPEQGRDEPAEVWYLFGAWLLAASFNAMLTWWGVSVAIANNGHGITTVGDYSESTLMKVVPIFVAVMVWLVRLLLIGTFSVAGERLFTTGTGASAPAHNTPPQPQYQAPRPVNQPTNQPVLRPASQINRPTAPPSGYPTGAYSRPAPKPNGSGDHNSGHH